MTRRKLFRMIAYIPILGRLTGIRNDTVTVDVRDCEHLKQQCKENHLYYANSHEYPCPQCEIAKLEYSLGHANGALSDIRTIVTDCVGKGDPERLHEICSTVYDRILSSDSKSHCRPGWFKHEWEQKLFEKYASGKFEPCGGGLRVYPLG